MSQSLAHLTRARESKNNKFVCVHFVGMCHNDVAEMVNRNSCQPFHSMDVEQTNETRLKQINKNWHDLNMFHSLKFNEFQNNW